MNKVEKEEKTARKLIAASNFVSESGHTAANYNLQLCGNIDLQHCVARGYSDTQLLADVLLPFVFSSFYTFFMIFFPPI